MRSQIDKALVSPRLFIKFWLESFKEALGKGWVVSGVVSAVIPDLLVVAGKVKFLATIELLRWVSENQNLARLYCVAVVVLAYLIYAPYRKYKETQIHAFKEMKKTWDRLNAVVKERDELQKKLDERPLTGIWLRNECDRWIEDAKAICKRLENDGLAAAPDAKEWLEQFPKFTSMNLPMHDHDRVNHNMSVDTFHQAKLDLGPSYEATMLQRLIGYRAAQLMIFRKTIH
jgi:hypothetical protein